MKRIFVFLVLLVVGAFLIGCNPSQKALWEKNKETGYNGGLVRHIRIIDAFTGVTVYDKTGKCFIGDGSTAGDIAILWTTENKKADFLGNNFFMIAEEQ